MCDPTNQIWQRNFTDLYKSWNDACSDYTKSSIENFNTRQGLAEEHHIWYGVKCVVERIWKESIVSNYELYQVYMFWKCFKL